ncbi:MAG: UvrD-helicase domain-containing protein [Akkermansiaceae bacterium]
MDSIELTRRKAEQLHRAALERGSDPWASLTFAKDEALRRGLDIESTSKGSPLLNGSRAIYDPVEKLILYENEGTDFEQASLVAHEIGHVEFGDSRSLDSIKKTELERPSEASPIGMARVVDYGKQQRREIQMDLFAREFLLPRFFVSSLHIQDGLSAKEIAKKLGAPYSVVAQQLLDALLLPEVDPQDNEAPDATYPLNNLQENAASHRGEAYLLEAGPGTGKTQTLIGRVEGLLAEGVDPRKILLLTFSNKAAGEMAERIAQKNKEAASAMWIGTFHAFGLDIIRRFHDRLGLNNEPHLLEKSEAIDLLEEEFPRLGLKHYKDIYDPSQKIADILAAVSRAKDEVVDQDRFLNLAHGMLEKSVTDNEREEAERCVEIAQVYAAYEKLKSKRGDLDYGDLVMLPVKLIEADFEVQEFLQHRYEHVLVDEYQDVNHSSVRLLTGLCGNGDNLWVVGDAKQSIYRFRGASSVNMVRFGKEDFPDGKRGRLKKNYRSVPEIVDTFSIFSRSMKVGDQDSGLEAERSSCNHSPELRKADTPDDQVVVLADSIKEMRSEGHSYRDQVVLCTGNDRLSKTGGGLERLGIPVLYLGSIFERPEVRNLLSLLSLFTDSRAMGLVRVGAMKEFPIPLQDVAIVQKFLRVNEGDPISWLSQIDSIADLSEKGKAGLQSLKAALDGFKRTSAPWTSLCSLLLDRTSIALEISQSNTLTARTQGIALWQLLNFVSSQPFREGLPITALLAKIRRMVKLGEDKELRQLPSATQSIDAVRIMTIHGAKGLEFPVVHLPGMNRGAMPGSHRPPSCPLPDGLISGSQGNLQDFLKAGHAEEQECLFYVALSRARDRLFTYVSKKQSGGNNQNPSAFMEKVGTGIIHSDRVPSRSLPSALDKSPIPVSFDGDLKLQAHQLGIYERCPRRFFYSYILKSGGRRTATTFMKMHEAVRSVVTEFVKRPELREKPEDLAELMEIAFKEHDLSEHGYVADYRQIVEDMVSCLLKFSAQTLTEKPEELAWKEDGVILKLQPDQVTNILGSKIFRQIKTGSSRKNEDLGAAAAVMITRQSNSSNKVECLFLGDEVLQPIDFTDRKLQNRKDKIMDALTSIKAGEYPVRPSDRVCPGCPAFFICGTLAEGPFKKNCD